MAEMGMVERVRERLKWSFREAVEQNADMRFALTGVIMPTDAVWDRYAKAAIEAMREPPLDVLAAGHKAMFETPWDGSTAPMIGAGFDAMIDAALTSSAG